MELIQVGKNTYYIKNNTNIGIYLVSHSEVYLIDTGNDRDAGKKILKIIDEHGWVIKGIINTHSNVDHIGGNEVIQKRSGCDVLSYGREQSFIEYPDFESTLLYGGFPFSDLRNKFLMAKPSAVKDIEENLPEGLSYFSLKGHFVDMIGIKTSDDVYFLGDALFSLETISKYGVFFLYDVKSFLETLDYLKTLHGTLFIPSHVSALTCLDSLILENRKKVLEIAQLIVSFCKEERSFEEILCFVFQHYHLAMNLNQYVLVGSTIRSYLSYLCDEKKLVYEFQDFKMYWKAIR